MAEVLPDGVSKEDAKLLAPIVRELKMVEETRPVGEWMVNLAHYHGFQHAEWGFRGTKEGRLILPPRQATDQVQAIENRMQSSIDQMVALVMQQLKPPQVVPPTNMSIEERNAVEVANALSLHLAQATELDDAGCWEEFCRWLFLCGVGCDWEHWDPKKGRQYPSVGTELYSEGGHTRDIISPFDIYPQPNVSHARRMKRFTIRLLTTVAEIKKHYGKEVAADRGMSGASAVEWQMRYLGRPKGAESDAKAKYIYVYLERPSEEHPSGREIHFTLMNDQAERVLYRGDNPNPNGELQIAMESYRPFGTSNWSTSPASSIRLNGISYNELLSMSIQSAKNATRQVIMVPTEARVSNSTLTARDRSQLTVIPYEPEGGAPTPLAIPSPPTAVFELMGQLDKGRDDMTWQHATMRGQAPAQMRSQPGVQEVRESDLLPQQPLIDRLKETYCETMGWRLAMARKWFTERRVAPVMSRPNRWKTYDFYRGNLPKSNRFFIPTEPNMPLSLSGKMQVLQQMQQVAPPELIQALFSDIVQVDRVESVAGLEMNHREAQREEIERLQRGEPVGVDYLDEDEIHMDEMRRFRSRDHALFETLPPVVQAQFRDHYEAHESQQEEKLIRQAQLQQLAAVALGGEEGEGGEGGGTPSPAEPVGAGVE